MSQGVSHPGSSIMQFCVKVYAPCEMFTTVIPS